MAVDIKKIIEAKFRRDAKELKNTFLVNSIPKEKLNCFEMASRNINYSLENPIIFYYEGNDKWYIISDKRIIQQKGSEILCLNMGDILSVNTLLVYQKDIIKEKERGLDYILLSLKNGHTHKLNIEMKSFSVIDGVITYLVDKVGK